MIADWWQRLIKRPSEHCYEAPWLDEREASLGNSKYWVLDLETDGLHPKKNRILSVGAVAVDGQRLHYDSSLYKLLLYKGKLRGDSILIHGLSPSELAKGEPSKQVLHELCERGRNRIWVGFHASFDAQLLQNAFLRELGWRTKPLMVNIAEYLPLLVSEEGEHNNQLEYWCEYFGLDGVGRHHALGDATVTAELLLVVLSKARALGLATWGELNEKAKQWRQVRQHLHGGF